MAGTAGQPRRAWGPAPPRRARGGRCRWRPARGWPAPCCARPPKCRWRRGSARRPASPCRRSRSCRGRR
eukprot:10943801-Alexandrium_andersonii.AAC.1